MILQFLFNFFIVLFAITLGYAIGWNCGIERNKDFYNGKEEKGEEKNSDKNEA